MSHPVQTSGLLGSARRTRGSFTALVLMAAAVLWAAAAARAGTVEQEVLNDPGPVYTTFVWQVTSGSLSSGTFTIAGAGLSADYFSESDGFNNTFTYPSTFATGTVAGTQPVTDIFDPSENENPGVLGINFSSSDPSSDYLVEEIDSGYNFNLPQNMQPLFTSTTELGFGPEGASGDYWFAFQGSQPGSIIGGLIESDGDIKTFGVVPSPNAGVSFIGLLAIVGVVSVCRNYRQPLVAAGV